VSGAFGEGQRLVRATAIEADYVWVFEPVFSRGVRGCEGEYIVG